MLDPDITGHRTTDAWLNAQPPQNAPTLHTEHPMSACGRHPTGWGTQQSRPYSPILSSLSALNPPNRRSHRRRRAISRFGRLVPAP